MVESVLNLKCYQEMVVVKYSRGQFQVQLEWWIRGNNCCIQSTLHPFVLERTWNVWNFSLHSKKKIKLPVYKQLKLNSMTAQSMRSLVEQRYNRFTVWVCACCNYVHARCAWCTHSATYNISLLWNTCKNKTRGLDQETKGAGDYRRACEVNHAPTNSLLFPGNRELKWRIHSYQKVHANIVLSHKQLS